jgi:hypothetical protein
VRAFIISGAVLPLRLVGDAEEEGEFVEGEFVENIHKIMQY